MKLYELEKQLELMRDCGAGNLTDIAVRVSGINYDIDIVNPIYINKDSLLYIEINAVNQGIKHDSPISFS